MRGKGKEEGGETEGGMVDWSLQRHPFENMTQLSNDGVYKDYWLPYAPTAAAAPIQQNHADLDLNGDAAALSSSEVFSSYKCSM